MLTNTDIETLTTFVANLNHAIHNHESVTVGGGEFTPQELTRVRRALIDLLRQSGDAS